MERLHKFIIYNEKIILIFIILFSLSAVLYVLGCDVYFSRLADIIGLKDNYDKLFEYTLAFICLIPMVNWTVRVVERRIESDESRDEYREYLIRKLDDTGLKESSLNINQSEIPLYSKADHMKWAWDTQGKNDKRDIIALMLKNNDEITEYFKISKSQAKASFWFSVISCIVGLLALIVGIYGIVILKDVSVSVISLISGSISELISGTIFWVHNKSALQLNHYYDALHENEKFLSAVNIADKLSDEKRKKY